MHRALFVAQTIIHLAAGITFAIGVAYAWLWFVVLAAKAVGPDIGAVVTVISLLALVRIFHLGREPLIGWYQPWDHAYWIAVERLGSHLWQRPANGAAH